jgi:hypothetical protein
MKTLMTAGLVLSAVFAGSGKVHAYVSYPRCIIGDARAVDCVFWSREQCAQDGRNRGFGGQCVKNPFYNAAPAGLPVTVKKRSRTKKKT